MKLSKISNRSIEYLIGIAATLSIAAGVFLYAVQEPLRIEVSQEAQIYSDLDEAMTLYAENCAVCHGLAGEGIGSTPALNNIALRQSEFDTLHKVISRGLYDTAMPAWSMEDGGPLNGYQISELVTLLQYGDWKETQDRVVNLGLAPLVPFTTEPDPDILEGLANSDGNELLARGISLYAVECVACHGADGLGTSLAPALNDPNTQTYSDDKLRQILLNGVSGTLMAPWDDRLEDDDIDSLIALMVNWDQVPSGAIPAPERPVAVTEESLVMGSELYASNCARCHGPEGQGTQRAPALNVKGFLTEVSDAAIQQIIALGVPGTSIPAWGDRIAEADIQAIVGYIRAWEPTAPEVAEPARGGGGQWWQSSGGTSRGGAGGGPPWMRNDNPTTQGNAIMPSSGAIVEVQFDPHQPGDESTSSHQSAQRLEQGQGDPPIGASSQEHLPGENGGPPWSREESPESWWENLDWRAYTLFGAGMGLSILIILTAVVGLYRLDRSSV